MVLFTFDVSLFILSFNLIRYKTSSERGRLYAYLVQSLSRIYLGSK